jgi:serine/threonine protein kinase
MDFQQRYEFNPKTDLLGKGGFSKVYKATDTLLERTVALKFFTGTVSDKYQVLNEIKKVIRFEHPNLCKYYDVAVLANKNVFGEMERIEVGIMEYIDAGDFKSYTRKHPQHADKLLIDVLKGLAYLHRHGIAHRDLKPQNILIKIDEDEPVSKITDFGISKLIDGDEANSSALLGTIEYMAPEQFNPKRYGINGRITTNLDLWSFGLLVYEAVCHESFFGSRSGGISAEQVMANILSEASLAKAETLPPKYREIVTRCLVKHAADRVQNALELIPLFDAKTITVTQVQNQPAPMLHEADPATAQVLGPEPLANETQNGSITEEFTEEKTQVVDTTSQAITEATPVMESTTDVTGETQMFRPIFESTEEIQALESTSGIISEETQAIEPVVDTAEVTQVIEPGLEAATPETQVIEIHPLDTAEITQVIGPMPEEEGEKTHAIAGDEGLPVGREETNTKPFANNKKEATTVRSSPRPLQKTILLSAAAVLLILVFLAYALSDDSARPKPEKPSASHSGSRQAVEQKPKSAEGRISGVVGDDTTVRVVDSTATILNDTTGAIQKENVQPPDTVSKKKVAEPKKDDFVPVTFTTNKACYLRIDGRDYGEINKGGSKPIKLKVGDHRLFMEDKDLGTIKRASLRVTKSMAKTGTSYSISF